jgi:TPR repeat protein
MYRHSLSTEVRADGSPTAGRRRRVLGRARRQSRTARADGRKERVSARRKHRDDHRALRGREMVALSHNVRGCGDPPEDAKPEDAYGRPTWRSPISRGRCESLRRWATWSVFGGKMPRPSGTPTRAIIAVATAVAVLGFAGLVFWRLRASPATSCAERDPCLSACNRGDDEACVDLGVDYRFAEHGKRDLAAAEATLSRVCAKTGAGCQDLANLYRDAKGFEAKAPQAQALHARAIDSMDALCRGGDGRACILLGNLVDSERWPDRDPSRASKAYGLGLPLLQASCDHKDPRACAAVSGIYGRALGVPQDARRSYELEARACELGDRRSCRDAGHTYLKGRTELPADPVRGMDLLRRSCDLRDAASCWMVGEAYAYGRELTKDESKAAVFFGLACDLNDPSGCSSLARLDPKRSRELKKRALELAEKGCANDRYVDCDSVAYADEAQKAAMAARAQQITGEACDAGDEYGCSQLVRRIKTDDPTAAEAARVRGCALGWISLCTAEASDKPPQAAAPVASAESTPTAPLRWRTVHAGGASLAQKIKTEIAGSASSDSKVVVYVGATWCKPCRAFQRYRNDPRVVEALRGAVIIELDMDDWTTTDFKSLGYDVVGVPVFIAVDHDGRAKGPSITSSVWGDDVPENMAPPLLRFIASIHG